MTGKQPHEVFDLYLNTCPNQGSRTIRTEEAVLISMAYFQTALNKYAKHS
jgi:predicted SPOUT superfamily RNA methylase MTH1